jgi:hypothetical protein
MATLKQHILDLIKRRPGLTDRGIADILKGPGSAQQDVNRTCRELAERSILVRRIREDGLKGNYLSEEQTIQPLQRPIDARAAEALSEDFIKRVLDVWLRERGWRPEIAWGRQRGIDIQACRKSERWVIEVKGKGISPQAQGNYFLNGLSELLNRITDPSARYSLALPDLPRYQRLWKRLPHLVKHKLGLSMLFVDAKGTIREVR